MTQAPDIHYTLKIAKIPRIILVSILAAEEAAYAKTSVTRYLIESVQDILAFFTPKLVFVHNFSVGMYKIKPKTAQLAIRWAVNHRLLKIHKKDYKSLATLLPQFIISPRYNETIARVLLTQIKSNHPILSQLSWEDIAKDDYLIAKIYSGYMGAGGRMDTWKQNIFPGKVALKRLKCAHGICKTIQYRRNTIN